MLSPGDSFTVDVSPDSDGNPAVHGYLLILDTPSPKGWEPVWVLGAPWGETKHPSWRRWDGYRMSNAIGLNGPLHYLLPPEIEPGRYRLR